MPWYMIWLCWEFLPFYIDDSLFRYYILYDETTFSFSDTILYVYKFNVVHKAFSLSFYLFHFITHSLSLSLPPSLSCVLLLFMCRWILFILGWDAHCAHTIRDFATAVVVCRTLVVFALIQFQCWMFYEYDCIFYCYYLQFTWAIKTEINGVTNKVENQTVACVIYTTNNYDT